MIARHPGGLRAGLACLLPVRGLARDTASEWAGVAFLPDSGDGQACRYERSAVASSETVESIGAPPRPAAGGATPARRRWTSIGEYEARLAEDILHHHRALQNKCQRPVGVLKFGADDPGDVVV